MRRAMITLASAGFLLLALTTALSLLGDEKSELVAALINGLFALLGVVVGIVATAWFTREIERDKQAEAKKDSLRALLNEIGRIREISEEYIRSQSGPIALPHFPTQYVEITLIGGSITDASTDLMSAATEYLAIAEKMNSIAEAGTLALSRAEGSNSFGEVNARSRRSSIQTLCRDRLAPLLDRLDSLVNEEMRAVRAKK